LQRRLGVERERTEVESILVVEGDGALEHGEGEVVGKLEAEEGAELRPSEALPKDVQLRGEGEQERCLSDARAHTTWNISDRVRR
jgi:hypothetical protein